MKRLPRRGRPGLEPRFNSSTQEPDDLTIQAPLVALSSLFQGPMQVFRDSDERSDECCHEASVLHLATIPLLCYYKCSTRVAKSYPIGGGAVAQTAEQRERERVRQMAWRAANRERVREQQRQRRIAHPERAKAWSDKYRATHVEECKARTDRYRAEHRAEITAKRALADADARVAYRVAYYAEHGARIRAKLKVWKAENPERVNHNNRLREIRKNGAAVSDLTTQQWQAIKAMFDHRCVYCGKQPVRLTQDHIVPLSKGGNHTVSNVVPACKPCNSKKWANPPAKPVQPALLV